jgi:phosphoribosylformylglycinamidine (FGAM) synthase PurS component
MPLKEIPDPQGKAVKLGLANLAMEDYSYQLTEALFLRLSGN